MCPSNAWGFDGACWCWERGYCPVQRCGEQQPTWEPWQHWALPKTFLTRGNSQLSCAYSSAKHFLQHPCSLRVKPVISPYRDPRISVLLACVTTVSGSVVWLPAPCEPFFKSHPNVFSEFLLSTHLWSLGLPPCKVTKPEQVSRCFPISFSENLKHCSGFLGSQTAEEKIMLLEAVWVDDSAILPVHLCAFARSLPFSQSCASAFLWNPCGLLEECNGSSRFLALCKYEYRGSQSTFSVFELMKCLSPGFYPKNMAKEKTSQRMCLCIVITGCCRLNKHFYHIGALLPRPLGGLSHCHSVRYRDGNRGKSFLWKAVLWSDSKTCPKVFIKLFQALGQPMIMSNRRANCTLCFPGYARTSSASLPGKVKHRQLCLGELQTGRAHCPRGSPGGHCLCQRSVLRWECFPWVQVTAELVQGVPSDVRTFGCSQEMQCYL